MSHMDINGDGSVTIEEAVEFWKAALHDAAIPKTAAHRTSPSLEGLRQRHFELASEDTEHVRSLFINVDVDPNGRLTLSEFLGFFECMKTRGYSEEDVAETCEAIVANGTWTAWKENRCIVSIRAWELGSTSGASCSRNDGPACSEFSVADMGRFEFEPSDGELLGPCPNIYPGILGECESRGGPDNQVVNERPTTSSISALRARRGEGDAHGSSGGSSGCCRLSMQLEAKRAELEPHPSADAESRDSRERLDRAMWIWNQVHGGHNLRMGT